MIGYTACEQAVLARILDHFSDELNANRCVASDIDSMFLSMLEEDAIYGCLIDYQRGGLNSRSPFKEDVWTWDIIGIFMVRFMSNQSETDAQVRSIIGKLSTMFYEPEHKRLGGLVPLARITSISQPEAEQVNDVPFYWIPFSVEVIDK